MVPPINLPGSRSSQEAEKRFREVAEAYEAVDLVDSWWSIRVVDTARSWLTPWLVS